MTSRLPALTAAAIAALLSSALLTACNDEADPEPDPDSRRGIDARAYYRDYESMADDDSGGTVQYSMPSVQAESESRAGTDSFVAEPPRPPRPNEDNFFEDAGTSGFVETAADDRST